MDYYFKFREDTWNVQHTLWLEVNYLFLLLFQIN